MFIGHVARACGLKPTNEQVAKAAGHEYKKLGKSHGVCSSTPIHRREEADVRGVAADLREAEEGEGLGHVRRLLGGPEGVRQGGDGQDPRG